MFDPEDFLRLAQNLRDTNIEPIEALYRTIISRAYYAAFLYTRNMLMSMNYTFTEERSVHSQVIFALKKYLKLRVTADQLDRLRKLRRKADYDTVIDISDLHVKMALNLSNNIISMLKNIPKRHSSSAYR